MISMKRVSFAVALFAAFGMAGPLTAAPQTPPAALDPQSNALFKRMVALNHGLHTYEAVVHFDVALRTFPFLSPSLDGNVYYKEPDKEAVVFDTVPLLAAQFKKVYPRIDPPVSWLSLYEVAVLSDDGASSVFRLVPKKNGRVEHLDVVVDDASATIKGYTWTYKDGGYVTFDQQFTSIGGNYLVQKQSGHVDLPNYKADIESTFSDYKLNVAIQDSVFQGN